MKNSAQLGKSPNKANAERRNRDDEMGTDITCFAEKRVNGVWILAEPLQENPFFDSEYPEDEPRLTPQPIMTTRNRALFAILADVTNPMWAEKPYNYISLPRGIPDDASPNTKDYYSFLNTGVFAASWILLKELLAFDWTQIIRRRRWSISQSHTFSRLSRNTFLSTDGRRM